ncbi:MAG: hypothetical protein IJX02_05935 [Clostridia bacterium]|nr:hypothetical protein [Clostridia bacterium]
MKQVEKKYRSVPFWSWNDTLDKDELVRQIEWMDKMGIGGFFMHARGGLKTEYLGKHWFDCIDACAKRAKELGMEAYAYDENGWPSGFAGGELLKDIENHDRYLTYSFGEYDKDAYVSYEISTGTLKAARAGDTRCLNVYEHYSVSTADILNPQVVKDFLEITHKEYEKRDKYSLKGFFTDEPQYYRWGVPYTKMLPLYFEREYGMDIKKGLGLLFVKKRGWRDFRYKFWCAMQDLMLNSFAKQIYDWCEERGYKLTGHYIEESYLAGQMNCCAGVMPFYEYEQIPGIDYLGTRITEEMAAKQVGSVAAQLGKEQVLTETFAACGWNISPIELKTIAESQYVGGVNLMCQHLLPYHEQGQRKRDYPSHFSEINPWVKKGFKTFNDYFSYLGKTLARSEEIVNVGVLHPIRSAYFDYDPLSKEPYNGLGYLEKPFFDLIEQLCHLGIGHHYIDEVLLKKHGRVEGSSLILGKCKYDYIIVPEILTMDKSTEATLRQYIENGGKVYLWGKKPQYIEGKRYTYKYLKTNTSLDEIVKSQPYSMEHNTCVRAAYRRGEDGREFIYAVNVSNEECTVKFNLSKGTSFEEYDILTDSKRVIPTEVKFDVGQSYLLYVSGKKPMAKRELKDLTLSGEFTVQGKPDNYITLDTVSYSCDGGVNYTAPRYHLCALDELLHKRYEGELYLKYTVKIDTPPTKCALLCEDNGILEITVNGKGVKQSGESPLSLAALSYDVADKLKKGENEIIIKINYFQGENVYYALFGENVTESLLNCLAYDTDIEPVYLVGDFGVYGDFRDEGSLTFGEGFRLGKQRNKISSLTHDGYPFMSGEITLTKKVDLSDTGYALFMPSTFHLIDVKVNGRDAGEMMMSRRLDISEFLRVGENEITLTLSLGRRNLLGPFHTYGENTFVGPGTFERFGTWKNGESPHYRKSYSFVKSLI